MTPTVPVIPTVSVVLCSFDGELFIEKQLRSILGQDLRPDEIIVSDDGSTDATLSIVRSVLADRAADGVRAIVLEGPRRGVTANFAAAIAASAGDIVVLSDQDDVWDRDRIRTSLEVFAEDTSVLLHHTDAWLIDAAGRRMPGSLYAALGIGERELSSINSGGQFSVYLRRNLATGAVTAIRRELAAAAAPFPDNWVHDEWLAIVAAAMGGVRAGESRPVSYRQHGGNQIGVPRRTLAYRVRRMLRDPPGRNARLSAQFGVLADRLGSLRDVEYHVVTESKSKAAFERARSLLPSARVRRLGPIGRLLLSGRYSRFSSQGRLDAVRDLVRAI